MTPAEADAQFITLWEQGLETAIIAERLGIKATTAQSRAHRLQQKGLIEPRPRGGDYPSRRAQARPEDPPATPPRAPAPAAPASTRAPPAITGMAVPEVRELIHIVKDLVSRVAALEAGTRGATRDPPAPASPPAAHPREHIKQWTVRLSQPLIEAVKTQAATKGKEPSHLVEELLWLALAVVEEADHP
jgi:hypothetical protein